jgi:hypothetical protein
MVEPKMNLLWERRLEFLEPLMGELIRIQNSVYQELAENVQLILFSAKQNLTRSNSIQTIEPAAPEEDVEPSFEEKETETAVVAIPQPESPVDFGFDFDQMERVEKKEEPKRLMKAGTQIDLFATEKKPEIRRANSMSFTGQYADLMDSQSQFTNSTHSKYSAPSTHSIEVPELGMAIPVATTVPKYDESIFAPATDLEEPVFDAPYVPSVHGQLDRAWNTMDDSALNPVDDAPRLLLTGKIAAPQAKRSTRAHQPQPVQHQPQPTRPAPQLQPVYQQPPQPQFVQPMAPPPQHEMYQHQHQPVAYNAPPHQSAAPNDYFVRSASAGNVLHHQPVQHFAQPPQFAHPPPSSESDYFGYSTMESTHGSNQMNNSGFWDAQYNPFGGASKQPVQRVEARLPPPAHNVQPRQQELALFDAVPMPRSTPDEFVNVKNVANPFDFLQSTRPAY